MLLVITDRNYSAAPHKKKHVRNLERGWGREFDARLQNEDTLVTAESVVGVACPG